MPPPIVHHPAYDAAIPAGHRFPMGKFRRLAELLLAEGLAPEGFREPSFATAAELSRAHDEGYVQRVLSQTLTDPETRRIGLPVTADVARRACASVGGGLLAARLALEHGIACNTAGGSHHAGPWGGAGFCVFNDAAVAALTLLAEGAIRRALIVDLDVHQGDGTAAILANEPRVFTLSVHCAENYPVRKQVSDLDVALPKGAGDAAYLQALAPALSRAFAASRPDLVLYNAGVDPHAEDRLGLLALSDDGLARRDEMVLAAARAEGSALAGLIGGGYGPDLDAIARRHAILHRTAARVHAGA